MRLLIYSGTTTLASALVQTGFLFAQLTILTMLGRDADTGVFAAAARIALLTSWVQWAFSAPFTPLIAQSLHTPNAGKRLNSTYHHVISGVLWVNGPFLAGLIVSAPAVLGLFGPGFTSGVGALVILSLGQWANSATALTEEFLPLGNRSGLALATNVGAVALLVAIGVPLGSRYGITGVAFASAAAIVVVNAVRSVQIYRLYGIVLPLRTVLVAGASLAIAVAGFTNLAWTWSTHPGMQFAAGVLAAAITATIMWIFGSAEDRRALMALMYGGAARTSDANLSG